MHLRRTIRLAASDVALPDGFVPAAVLELLTAGQLDEDGLAERCVSDDVSARATAALIEVYSLVEQLRRLRLIDDVFSDAAGHVVAAVNLPPGCHHWLDELPPAPADAGVSRFVYAHARESGVEIHEPLGGAILCVPDLPALAQHSRLARALLGSPTDSGEAFADELDDVLFAAGFLVPADTGADVASDPTSTWEFHDLVFHGHSRAGRYREPFGATYPYLGTIGPEPSHFDRRFPDGRLVELAAPDDPQDGGPPLFSVLEQRRSRRDATRTITIGELGLFLHHCARITRIVPANAGEPMSYPTTRRPYPSGGASYDLEIYPVVARCDGLEPGIYYYNPASHALEHVRGPCDATGQLISLAATSTGGLAEPQILLVITSRVRRLTWKYRAIAYATTLKNVGTLYQTFYLVATALGLAPCALGAGSSLLFAGAAGLDEHAEPSVGEFLIGA